MPAPEVVALARLPDYAFGGGLVLCRVAGVVSVMPGLGETSSPMVVRAGLALVLTFLIAPSVAKAGFEPALPLEVLRLVATEIICGLFIGWLARLVAMALPIAGQFISLFTGLTSVVQPDPEFGAQASAITRLFSLIAPVLLLSSGLFALPLDALSSSYRLLPIGGPLPAGDTLQSVVVATSEAFGIGLRLAAPFLLIATVWHVALSILGRVAPAMQIGAVFGPGQVLGGLFLLAMLGGLTVHAWLDSAGADLSSLAGLLNGG